MDTNVCLILIEPLAGVAPKAVAEFPQVVPQTKLKL
jgi:ABC-type lipopolysaccharide export system ATPase subunit